MAMSEEVKKIDGHRFDDIFYAYKQLFLNRSFVDVCWTDEFYETNFERVSAFPIDIVSSYVERLLHVHGSGPLLHNVIAANFECQPVPFSHKEFMIIVQNTYVDYTFRKGMMGLISACGLVTIPLDESSNFKCLQCRSCIVQGMGTGIFSELRKHAMKCDMLMDCRYLRPLKEFRNKSDYKPYMNFLHKSVAQAMITKLGVLIVRPKRFDELPLSAFASNRFDSLYTVLQSSGRMLLDDETLDRIGEAGYHTLFNQTEKTSRCDFQKLLNEYEQIPVADRKISCFCCCHEVTMCAEFVSDPWRYHAMESPSCIYLLMKMGWKYVQQVRESMHDLHLKNTVDPTNAVINPKWNLQPPTTPMGEFFDLRKGVTDKKKKELRVALSSTKMPSCAVCCIQLRAVALMACSHITTCVDCSFSIRECPLCRMMITGYMIPVYQPDGSFWKQPDCVGGNYFINLPCGHLIESCVPTDVERCPKADAVEEDNIYCIVCGDSKLGKLKVYI